jgi:hypothetical protein
MPGTSVAFRLVFRQAGATPTKTSRSSTRVSLPDILPRMGHLRPSRTCFVVFDTTSVVTLRVLRSGSRSAAFSLKNSGSSCAALAAGAE